MILVLFLTAMGFHNVQAQDNKHSIGVQGAFNFNKTGVGIRYGYNFTDVLRFAFDGTYYTTSNETMNVYHGETVTETINNGRIWDFNANLNFVYGDHNFHFYIIAGLGFTSGYKFKSLTNIGHYVDGQTWIYDDDMHRISRIGVSLNGGCGIEWQIIPMLRWNLEQSLNIGLPALTTWMCKTGLSYCF